MQLVIVNHTLEIARPHRVCRLSEFQFGNPRCFGGGRLHHIGNAANALPPIQAVITQQLVTAHRVKYLTCNLPLAVYLLHFAFLCRPRSTLVRHKAIVLATVERQQVELALVGGVVILEAHFNFVKAFALLTEILNEITVVYTAQVVARSIEETECNLFVLILFPIALCVKPSIGEALHCRTECRNRVVGCGVVHLQACQFDITFRPSTVKGSLCWGQIVAAERTISSVHQVANTAVVSTRTVRVVHLYSDDTYRD